MKSLDKKNPNVLSSFKIGFMGLFDTIKKERNIKIGLGIIFCLIIISLFLNLSNIEWILIILTSGLVLIIETINTSIETVVDMTMPDIHPLAKISKDTAAAAVILMVIISFIVGLIIYVPKIISFVA